jgi:hypothetical protein
MSKNFKQNPTSLRGYYESKYATSRANLLLTAVFTVINLILLITNSNTYFLFSAFIPYYITSLGMLMCGRYPEEYYTDGLEDIIFINDSFFAVTLTVAVVMVLFYLLAWLLSKKRRVGWLILSLVFFSLDTILMLLLNGIALDWIMDILFHGYVIYFLIIGINAHFKLKKLPLEEETATDETILEDGFDQSYPEFPVTDTEDKDENE